MIEPNLSIHFFGKPCAKNPEHIIDSEKSIRYIVNNTCVECVRARERVRSKKRNEAMKGFRKLS